MTWIDRRHRHINRTIAHRAEQQRCQSCGGLISLQHFFSEVRNVEPEDDWADEPPTTYFCASCFPRQISPRRVWFYSKHSWDGDWWRLVQWNRTGDEWNRRCVVLRIPGGYMVIALGTASPSTLFEEEQESARP